MSTLSTAEAVIKLLKVPGIVRVANTRTRTAAQTPRLRVWARCGSRAPICFIIPYRDSVSDAAVRAALIRHLGAESAAAY